MMDIKNLPSINFSAIDKPMIGFTRMELLQSVPDYKEQKSLGWGIVCLFFLKIGVLGKSFLILILKIMISS